MAFQGMNPEEGVEVATAVTESGRTIMEIISEVTNLVGSVEWVGPDYDSFLEEWNTFNGGPVAELVNGLQEKGNRLNDHAEEQTETSNQG